MYRIYDMDLSTFQSQFKHMRSHQIARIEGTEKLTRTQYISPQDHLLHQGISLYDIVDPEFYASHLQDWN
jgi:hypothetical protein